MSLRAKRSNLLVGSEIAMSAIGFLAKPHLWCGQM